MILKPSNLLCIVRGRIQKNMMYLIVDYLKVNNY